MKMTLLDWLQDEAAGANRFLARQDVITGVKAALLMVFVVLTNGGVAHYLDIFANLKSPIGNTLVLLLTWLVFLCALGLVAWTPNRTTRLAWAGALVLCTIIVDAAESIVGGPVSYGDAQMYWAMRADAGAAILTYWSEILKAILFGLLGLLAFALPPAPQHNLPRYIKLSLARWRHRLPFKQLIRSSHIETWGPALPIALICFVMMWSSGKMTVAFPAQYKLPTFIPMATAAVLLQELPTRDQATLPITHKPLVKHVLVIVDESVRADYIDLNVNRKTTPYLVERKDVIANFGYAASGHNCSDQANALLRWGVTPTTLIQAYTLPTIWQYAKRAGFTTVNIDVQKRKGTLQNYLSEAEIAQIDWFVQHNDLTPDGQVLPLYEKDTAAAKIVKDLLKSPQPHFIYLNKEGIHFPYEGKYPSEESVFANHMGPLEPIGGNKDRLINSYKNGTYWSVNHFFEIFLEDIDLSDVLVIYTSDHGQNLLDDGLLTHCRSANPHYTEGLVPLFIMAEDTDVLGAFDKAAQQNFNKASHFNIFPTLLTVMGYSKPTIREKYGPSLFDKIEEPRAFASGFIFDRSNDWTWTALPETAKAPRPAQY